MGLWMDANIPYRLSFFVAKCFFPVCVCSVFFVPVFFLPEYFFRNYFYTLPIVCDCVFRVSYFLYTIGVVHNTSYPVYIDVSTLKFLAN